MSELLVTIDDELLSRLRAHAASTGTTTQELVLRGIDFILRDSDVEFQQLLDEMLHEDAELFRRLA
jgi:hypothetical protein